MCSNCLVFVCGLEHTFMSTRNHTQIVVHICKFYFSLADHVIHICDHFESNFSPQKSIKECVHACTVCTDGLEDWYLLVSLSLSSSLSLFPCSPRVYSSAPWTRWKTSRGASLFLFLALRPLRRTSSLSRSTSSTYSTLGVRTPISPFNHGEAIHHPRYTPKFCLEPKF